MSDRTQDGCRLILLAVIDEYTRECLTIVVARSFTAPDVVGILQYLFAVRGTPQHLRSNNGPEFVAKTLFITKGSPGEGGYIESAGGKLRDELFSRKLF